MVTYLDLEVSIIIWWHLATHIWENCKTIVNPKYNFLLHTINSNKTHSIMMNFMVSGSSSTFSNVCRRWNTVWSFMAFLLPCEVSQNKAALLKVCPVCHNWKKVELPHICSSVNMELSSPSYFRQFIRLLQAHSCNSAIRFIS